MQPHADLETYHSMMVGSRAKIDDTLNRIRGMSQFALRKVFTYIFLMKKCYLCKKEKHHNEFYGDKTRKDGLSSKCKQCSKTYVKKNIDQNRTHKKCPKCNQELPLEAFAKSKYQDGFQNACRTCRSLIPYGISPEQYATILGEQNGLCAICGLADKLVIDHCHNTNKVRGLLCIKCNWALGHFEDSTERLAAAIEYLS